MSKPKISVIVPVYNAGEYLRECIESVISQSFSEWELLLVDDGSKDGSGAVCDEYVQKDGRIRVFHKENGGVCSARNLGLDNAQGEWIAFLDADDYFPKDALKVLHDKTTGTGADLVMGKSLILKEGKLFHNYMQHWPAEPIKEPLSSVRKAVWGYIFRSQIIQEHSLRFIDGLAYSEDQIYILQYALLCKRMVITEAPVYVYRIIQTSACRSKDGVRTAIHQFEAAKYSYSLAQRHKANAAAYKAFYRLYKSCVGSGIGAALWNGQAAETRKLLERYKEIFGSGWRQLSLFYRSALRSIFMHYTIAMIKKLHLKETVKNIGRKERVCYEIT